MKQSEPFLENRDFTHTVQYAISIDGDSDTIAAMKTLTKISFSQGLYLSLYNDETIMVSMILEKLLHFIDQ
jgi:hypothetical protein